VLAPVRFLRASSRSVARKSLIGMDGVMVSRIFASWNQLERWFRDVDGLRRVA
jgi:hypothetical protein